VFIKKKKKEEAATSLCTDACRFTREENCSTRSVNNAYRANRLRNFEENEVLQRLYTVNNTVVINTTVIIL